MERLLLCVLLLSALTQYTSSTTPCHSKCRCFWLKGKQTADCSSAGFHETIPDGLEPSLQVLNLTRNDFKRLPRNAFLNVGLVNLQKVYLSHCGIESIDDSALKLLSNLVELDLSDNALSYVPTAAFRGLASLRVLVLSGNPLRAVPTLAFAGLNKSLKVLRMSNCGIRAVASGGFENLEMLEFIHVDGNELTTLRIETLMKKLRGVSLVGNPWTCDCELLRLRQWLNGRYVDYVEPTCFRPSRLRGRKWSEVTDEDYACPRSVDVFGEEEGSKENGEEQGISIIGMLLEILSAML